MTSCLFLDPTANYIKVNYFPEEPEVLGHTDDELCAKHNCKLRVCYEKAVAAARASAVKVKNQEQAWRLIFPELQSAEKLTLRKITVTSVTYRIGNSWYERSVRPNVLYPIPGMRFTVEQMPSVTIMGREKIKRGGEKVAVLELPYLNNTDDNSKPMEPSSDIIKFLLGESDFWGMWFGDKKDGKAFWWREFLRSHIEALKSKVDDLESWKKTSIEVWSPVIDWGHNESGLKVGESISNEVIRRCREYDSLKSERDKLAEENEMLMTSLLEFEGLTIHKATRLRNLIDRLQKSKPL